MSALEELLEALGFLLGLLPRRAEGGDVIGAVFGTQSRHCGEVTVIERGEVSYKCKAQ